MMSQMDIPEEIRLKLMEQLGVSSDHIDEALGMAQKSPNNIGVTPFLQHMRRMSEYFKTFKNQEQKLQQFASSKTVMERLELVSEALSGSAEFRNVDKLFSNSKQRKHDPEKSKHFRDKGNKLYQHKKFNEALEAYTEAMHEVSIDEHGKCPEIGLALGNRSAVFFQKNEYSKCLEDIEASIMFGYPEELQYKLMDRKGRCLQSLGRLFEAQEALEMASLLVQKSKLSSEDKTKFKLELKKTMTMEKDHFKCTEQDHSDDLHSFDQHPCVPGLSSKLEIRYEDTRGRHSVACQDIGAGEMVGMDCPVTWCLSHNYARSHCHHCCSPLLATGYPSPLSRHETVMFCSLVCLQTGVNTYHGHEARLPLSQIFSIQGGSGNGFDEISGAVLMVLRAITQQSLAFFTDTDWLAGEGVNMVPTEVNDDDDGLYKYKALFNMVNHTITKSNIDLLSTTMKTIFILHVLEAINYGSMANTLRTIGPIIFHLLETVQYNSHPIDVVKGDIDPNKNVNLVEIGSGVYPCLATCLNHSCDPSTIRISKGNQMMLFARRKISFGEEVSDCYGFHYTSLVQTDRRQRLEKWFRFRCECEACTKGYPVMNTLTSNLIKKHHEILKDILEKFQWSLKNRERKKALDFSIQYLRKIGSLNVLRPHKAWEAGSHALTCALWSKHSS